MNDAPIFQSPDLPIPAIRDTIELIPYEEEGQRLVLLRDASGYSSGMVALPPEALALLSFFNGTQSVNELTAEIHRHTGTQVDPTNILTIVGHLDSLYLLANERSEAFIAGRNEAFRAATEMQASNAGLSYPEDPEELRAFLETILPRVGEAVTPAPLGLIIPHIDMRIGGEVYAAGYERLRGADIDTCIILGTAHHDHDDIFIMTEKDFASPLGTLRTDTEFVGRLRENAGNAFTTDDTPHMFEHSIEFQALCVQHLFGNDRVKIVPVLCGSLEFLFDEDMTPQKLPRYQMFIEAMQQTLAELDRRVCFVMSVDWSHIGLKFGDSEPAADRLDAVRASDHEHFDALTRVDFGAFHALVKEGDNPTNIDGYTCISTFLDVARPREGRLLAYRQWHEEERESAVTYAAMEFTRSDDAGGAQLGLFDA